jgi:hypothetical protein
MLQFTLGMQHIFWPLSAAGSILALLTDHKQAAVLRPERPDAAGRF